MKSLKKILYAEDEVDIRTIVEISVWSTSNYSIKVCGNGKEVIDCVEDYMPDLILLDVMMQGMDGIETLRQLRKNELTRNIPVIFLTAKAQVHEVQDLIDKGIAGVITKPFDPMSLCAVIKDIWEKKINKKVTA